MCLRALFPLLMTSVIGPCLLQGLQPSVSTNGKKGWWIWERDKKEIKERELVPLVFCFFSALLSVIFATPRLVCYICAVSPCDCVPMRHCLLFLWVCFCQDCGPPGRKGPGHRCELGKQQGEQSSTLYWLHWRRSGCNLIQYPAITEPRCTVDCHCPHAPNTHNY